jgi:hypothetical protein
VRMAPCDLFSDVHHNSHSFFLLFNLSSLSTYHYHLNNFYQLPTTHQECQPITTPKPMLDPPLEAFTKEMAHGLLLCLWIPNSGYLDNIVINHHLHRVITDDVLITIIQVPVLHLDKMSANGCFTCNLVT